MITRKITITITITAMIMAGTIITATDIITITTAPRRTTMRPAMPGCSIAAPTRPALRSPA